MARCPQGCNSKPYIHGHHGKQNTPRFKCPRCGKTFSQSKRVCESLNIPKETVYRILSCLTEGCGVRATARLNQVHPETVLKVLRIAGEKAEGILDRKLRNIRATQVQIDEAWTFVGKKQRSVRPDDHPDHGDQWCFLAITEHKLITAYALGSAILKLRFFSSAACASVWTGAFNSRLTAGAHTSLLWSLFSAQTLTTVGKSKTTELSRTAGSGIVRVSSSP